MSPADRRALVVYLRAALGESTAMFAKRFARSSRTVEDWEQGRRSPDALALEPWGASPRGWSGSKPAGTCGRPRAVTAGRTSKG